MWQRKDFFLHNKAVEIIPNFLRELQTKCKFDIAIFVFKDVRNQGIISRVMQIKCGVMS